MALAGKKDLIPIDQYHSDYILLTFAKVLDVNTWSFVTPNANYHIKSIYISTSKVQTFFSRALGTWQL